MKKLLNTLCAVAALCCICGFLVLTLRVGKELAKSGYLYFWDGFTVAAAAFAVLLTISLTINIVISTLVMIPKGGGTDGTEEITPAGAVWRSLLFIALTCVLMFTISATGELDFYTSFSARTVLGKAIDMLWIAFIASPVVNLISLVVHLIRPRRV